MDSPFFNLKLIFVLQTEMSLGAYIWKIVFYLQTSCLYFHANHPAHVENTLMEPIICIIVIEYYVIYFPKQFLITHTKGNDIAFRTVFQSLIIRSTAFQRPQIKGLRTTLEPLKTSIFEK